MQLQLYVTAITHKHKTVFKLQELNGTQFNNILIFRLVPNDRWSYILTG